VVITPDPTSLPLKDPVPFFITAYKSSEASVVVIAQWALTEKNNGLSIDTGVPGIKSYVPIDNNLETS
jgi:hypothetical protein